MKTPFRRFVLAKMKVFALAVAEPPQHTDVDVPCGKCRACCRTFDVGVTRADLEREPRLDVTGEWTTTPEGRAVTQLRHRDDGTCVHLGFDGCQVYAGRPALCRTFDCRVYGVLRLGSLAVDPRREANFEALNVAAFHRTDMDIDPPSTPAEERALRTALLNRRPNEDTGSAAVRGIVVIAKVLEDDGDQRARVLREQIQHGKGVINT